MRTLLFAALFALTACATTADTGPRLRYADAASRGAWASLLVGRPSQAQVDRASEDWAEALRESIGCDVPTRDVIRAGLAGALEMAAMNAAASGGGEREVRDGVSRYVGQLALMTISSMRHSAPANRCEELRAWAPRIANEGREAVDRARRNGLIESNPLLEAFL